MYPSYLSKIDAVVAMMIAAADTFAAEERTCLRPLPHPFLHRPLRPRPRTPGCQLAGARRTALSGERALAVEESSAAVAAGVPSSASAVVEAGPPASVAAEAGPSESAAVAAVQAAFAEAVQPASAVEAEPSASAVAAGPSASAAEKAGRLAVESSVAAAAAAVAAASETAETSPPEDGNPPVRHLRNALAGEDRLRNEAHGNPY